jgi:hypothetical protein
MITALMLLPVTAILGWLYGYLLPAGVRWNWFDTSLLSGVLLIAGGWIVWTRSQPVEGAGPVWNELVAAAGAYTLLVCFLGLGLAWRRLRAGRVQSR